VELETRREAVPVPEQCPEMGSANTPDLMEEVLRGRLHFALGVQPVQDRDLWVEPIAREGFCFCLSKNHALATADMAEAHQQDC
jgi:DNA-binding transcriptional LysR family regulator